MAILQALRPKTLTRSLAFAGLCLILAGAAVLVWMFQFTNVNAAHPLKSSTEELDPAAQARIQQFVEATDAEKNYQVKTLDNEYFVSHNDVTDGGQELTGYFKNGDIQKIAYSVGLSFGLQKYLYYFDRGELVYVSVEEDDYLATNEGLDYEKTEPVFSGEYFFLNGKLLKTNAKGQGRYLSASTTNAGDGLMESATRYSALLAK
jgi:hypothetical protein